jgi:hypothetical protein
MGSNKVESNHITNRTDPSHITIAHSTEPRAYKEAMYCPDYQQWHQAVVEEVEAHLCNGTWTLVQLPPDGKTIGSHWVFKVKRNADGSLEHYID